MEFKRITVNPNQMGGVPCLRGLRIPVATVVGLVAEGHSVQETVAAYPTLKQRTFERPSCSPRRPCANACCRLPLANEVLVD